MKKSYVPFSRFVLRLFSAFLMLSALSCYPANVAEIKQSDKPVMVSDESALESAVGQIIELHGTAVGEIKGAAWLDCGFHVLIIPEIMAWPDSIRGHQLDVRGRLVWKPPVIRTSESVGQSSVHEGYNPGYYILEEVHWVDSTNVHALAEAIPVDSGSQLNGLIGERIQIRAVAEFKEGVVFAASDFYHFRIDELHHWPSDVLNQNITVTAKLIWEPPYRFRQPDGTLVTLTPGHFGLEEVHWSK